MAFGLDLHHQLSWGSGPLASPHDSVRQFRVINLFQYISYWLFLWRTLVDMACPAETGPFVQVCADFQSRGLLGQPLRSSPEPLFPKRGPPTCLRGISARARAPSGGSAGRSPSVLSPLAPPLPAPRAERVFTAPPPSWAAFALPLVHFARWCTGRCGRRRAAQPAPALLPRARGPARGTE